jgi:2-methylisocitrate lyase-like PEP mutase family enzyme
MARTDARATRGLDEALWRARAFADLGADIAFIEAPLTEDELARIGEEVAGPKMVNLVEQGDTPLLARARLEELGFKIAAYPLTLLSSAVRAMERSLERLVAGEAPEGLIDFTKLRELVGFEAYDRTLARYASKEPP